MKIIKQFAKKRVQGAAIIVLVWALQQFGVVVPDTVQHSISILLQAFGAVWGVYGIVDAHPGHKPPA